MIIEFDMTVRSTPHIALANFIIIKHMERDIVMNKRYSNNVVLLVFICRNFYFSNMDTWVALA